MQKLLPFTLLSCGILMSSVTLAADYEIDPHHTYVFFKIGHNNTSTNHARFDNIDGQIKFDQKQKTGSAEITLQVKSVNSGSNEFNQHLLNADIFDVAKYPTMKFKSTQFIFNGDKVSAVKGNLTLLGKTNPITLKATQFNCYDNSRAKTESCGGDFEAVIDRTLWGANYGIDWGFPKEVKIIIQIEAFKK